jgi:putative ABC transport system ATP-binding protein
MSSFPAPPSQTVLAVEGVGKSYGPQRVLSDISFTLRAGERLALTGPSGGGKTTLLNCVGGVDQPDQGTIRLGEVELTTLSSDGLAAVRRRQIGSIFQFFHLLPTLSAYENIELPLQLLGLGEPERAARVGELVRRVGLTRRSDALPSELSGGEQQRVAIARALVHRPALLLADEPTGNLDSANGAAVLALLRELTDESGVALVLVTHSEEAATLCHRRLSVHDGRLAGGA